MIAVDANVLLRYLLDDDRAQSKRASELILGEAPVLITDIVLVETVWTLKGKRYNLDKEAIIKVIQSLFEESGIVFESEQTVWRALNDFKSAKSIKSGGKRKEADFPDALIVNKAWHTASDRKTLFEGVYTFDVAAQQIPGTVKP